MVSESQGRDPWELATANYGEAVVAYLLDLPLGEQPDATDARRLEIVDQLSLSVDEDHLSDEQRISLQCHILVRVLPEEEMTYLECVRQYVGGRLPSNTGDELVDSLVRLVFNGLAMELIPGAEWDRFSVSASFQDPRLCTPAAYAFLNDPDLSALFPDAEREPDERGQIAATSLLTWLPAGGGTTFLTILIGNFVEQTLARMRFVEALTEDRVEEFVRESLDQLRKFARREDVDVLVLTGLVGIQAIDSLDCGTWGIRPAPGLAIADIPPRDRPRPKSVLWTKVPHRLVSCHRADIDEKQTVSILDNLSEQSRHFHATLMRKTMALRFGVLAWAVDREKHPAVNVQATASWSLMPIMCTQPPRLDVATSHTSETVLNPCDLAAVAEIVEELGEVTPRLDVALNRMVRVASERRDPADALIDAVIAWENMLGSKSETTFKVCAALSWLIEPEDEERRRTLFAKAKKIYDIRSLLIHGSEDSGTHLVSELGQEALALAVLAFRRIHVDSSLTDMRSSSRSDAILLRART